jgi:flagellar biosynthesis component FlhA
MLKSLNIENVSKGQLIKSMLIRLPIPVVAFFLAGFVAGVGGILSLFAGFLVFQIYYLIKIGSKLKEEIEKEAEELEKNKNKEKANVND